MKLVRWIIGWSLIVFSAAAQSTPPAAMQHSCNVNGTPLNGVKYVQEILQSDIESMPPWNPATDPQPLSIREIIQRGRQALDDLLPGYEWDFTSVWLSPINRSGTMMFSISFNIVDMPDNTDNFKGFSLMVTPHGAVPEIKPAAPPVAEH